MKQNQADFLNIQKHQQNIWNILEEMHFADALKPQELEATWRVFFFWRS